jgi:hypothetical protein
LMLFVIVFLEAEGNSGRNKKCEMAICWRF